MEYPFRKYERKPFDAAACTRCGKCLAECPVMQLPEEDAQREIASLMRCFSEPGFAQASTDAVLRRCTSCFACNLICPEDCRPANLFLDIWYRQYQREGLPERARYFLPHSVPNFRTYVLDRLPDDEKRAVASWEALDPVDEIFYPGCNIITSPYLTFSKLFDGMAIRGGLAYCCGEMYFRMGLYDHVEQAARKCSAYFKALGVKRVYLLCTAGLNLFTNILPQFGGDFAGITFVPYLKVLHERLKSGALPIVNRFDGKRIALQDSCHAKVYEERYYDWPRAILRLLGFEIIEAEHNRQGALCCGIGAGFAHGAAYAKTGLIRGQRRCMRNAVRARPDCIGVYCSGCLEMLSVAKFVTGPTPPVYHILELIQEAIGETPRRRQRRIAFDFLMGTLRNQRGGARRFRPPPIE